MKKTKCKCGHHGCFLRNDWTNSSFAGYFHITQWEFNSISLHMFLCDAGWIASKTMTLRLEFHFGEDEKLTGRQTR